MLDLETLGTSSNSLIVSIGAVKFDKDLGIIDRFYKVININSSIDKGFEISGDTLLWWLNQSEEARKELKNGKEDIKEVLRLFLKWLPKDNLQIWGNGCDFDNIILLNAFKKCNVKNPWPHWSNRCFRTLKYSFPTVENVKDTKVHHKAIDDAEYQANYLITLVEENNLKNVL